MAVVIVNGTGYAEWKTYPGYGPDDFDYANDRPVKRIVPKPKVTGKELRFFCNTIAAKIIFPK